MKEKRRLVVIGNGMAGARLVEEVIARGAQQFEIVVFGDEPYGNYNRILLSNVLSGEHDPKDIFLNPLRWYCENKVILHAGVRVEAIDRHARTVTGTDGTVEKYDELVIATGSSPFVPELKGLTNRAGTYKSGVFVFRTLDDCEKIITHAKNANKAAVIGGGLLGLEAARGLLELGLEVQVIHLMDHLMEAQLDSFAGAILRTALEKMGVGIHLGKVTQAVLGEDAVEGIRFEDGGALATDLLVISAGIRPNVQLAKNAGLSTNRGILVGDDLASDDDPHIHAVGECIEHRKRTYGLVAPLWEQAKILADRLTSSNPHALYRGSRESTKLKVMGIDLAVMGDKEKRAQGDEEVVYVEPSRGIYKKLIVRDGKLVGAIILGDPSVASDVVQLFDRGVEVPPNRAELLFPAAADGERLCVSDAPDDTQVCNCNGVTKGAIALAIQSGNRTLKKLCEVTRAGTGCGTCKQDVQTLLEKIGGHLIDDPSEHYYVPAVALKKADLVQEIKAKELRSVSAVFRALASGKDDAKSKAGLASLLKTIWGAEYEDERDARHINDRVHANVQNDGTFSVVPRIYGGVTSAKELRRIADVAEAHQVKMIKITGGQRIDLLGISKEKLPQVWKDLGMPSGHAYTKSFRTCKTCVGTDFCRYGLGDSTALGIAIERRFQGIEAPAKLKLAAAGCPRNCSEATTKDIGVVAIEGGKWEIYVGGAAGSRVRKGDILCVVDSHDEVLKFVGRFMQYYREHAKYLERTYDFVERVGIARLRRILLDDAEGICKVLDADMQATVDAYVDPWQEANTPAHPTQFASVLPAKRRLTLVSDSAPLQAVSNE